MLVGHEGFDQMRPQKTCSAGNQTNGHVAPIRQEHSSRYQGRAATSRSPLAPADGGFFLSDQGGVPAARISWQRASCDPPCAPGRDGSETPVFGGTPPPALPATSRLPSACPLQGTPGLACRATSVGAPLCQSPLPSESAHPECVSSGKP